MEPLLFPDDGDPFLIETWANLNPDSLSPSSSARGGCLSSQSETVLLAPCSGVDYPEEAAAGSLEVNPPQSGASPSQALFEDVVPAVSSEVSPRQNGSELDSPDALAIFGAEAPAGSLEVNPQQNREMAAGWMLPQVEHLLEPPRRPGERWFTGRALAAEVGDGRKFELVKSELSIQCEVSSHIWMAVGISAIRWPPQPEVTAAHTSMLSGLDAHVSLLKLPWDAAWHDKLRDDMVAAAERRLQRLIDKTDINHFEGVARTYVGVGAGEDYALVDILVHCNLHSALHNVANSAKEPLGKHCAPASRTRRIKPAFHCSFRSANCVRE